MIQVGHVLDKYELLERVGQGGMAVVYRGLDRTLKRTVAVKVLHKHLSDYQEARDRFEREAQVVAKLRHENILEIFDYAAKAESEAYIVTEFIDGQTLKQFITERPIAFPELGAMIMLQVCRALAHAHAGGILHRDVKPENIMIRSDGVVKLMDFGISHMVDLERLTVTGQLLGSPAYMAPEHVEGRPLDFRTDVFAAGIVLYQLTTGKLPFEGKNPHEVLKRIAECKFVDPRQVNPRIGNRLGRIVLRAMAPLPKDRYAAIGEMVVALESYLEESGLAPDKVASELARYFQAPASYERALEVRLVDHLTRRGQERLAADDQAAALDMFDRVLTIDPKNEKVLAILERINRRARLRRAALVMLGAAVLGGGGYMVHRRMEPPPPVAPVVDPGPTHDEPSVGPTWQTAHVEAVPDASTGADAPPDAVPTAVVAHDLHPIRPTAPPDAAPPVPTGKPLRVVVTPAKGSLVRFGDGPWTPVAPEDGALEHLIDRDLTVRVKNDTCCEEEERAVHVGQAEVVINLGPLPAKVVPVCDQGDVSVTVNGQPASLGVAVVEPFDRLTTQTTKTFDVAFLGPHVDPAIQHVTVRAKETKQVPCVPR